MTTCQPPVPAQPQIFNFINLLADAAFNVAKLLGTNLALTTMDHDRMKSPTPGKRSRSEMEEDDEPKPANTAAVDADAGKSRHLELRINL